MGSHLRFQGETTSASQLKFLLSTSRTPKSWVSPPPWALQKNPSKKWFGTNGFQPVEDFFLLEKNLGRKWQQRKPESQHPNTTSMVNTSPESMDSSSNTTPAEEKHHGEDLKHQSCVFYGLRDKKYPKFSKKKNKPKGRFVCFVLGRIKKQVSEWMNLMKLKSGFKGGNPVTPLKTHIRRLKNPSPFHQRSAFFGLCRKPGHHVCVCVKPSSHRVLPHLQVMPGWGWTCPSQGGDLLGL